MKNITLNLGGELIPGDVVGVSYNNCVIFGWYVESGKYGSLKFISFHSPANTLFQYNGYLKSSPKAPYLDKKYAQGLQFKHFYKDYIISFDKVNNRAFKVPNPEEFFKDSDTETLYLQSRETLRNINFPAK